MSRVSAGSEQKRVLRMDIPGCPTGTRCLRTDAIARHRVGPTNQGGQLFVRNPDTVNMIYTAVSVGHRYANDGDDQGHLCARIRFPRISSSWHSKSLPTYSLFYRNRKDVRQLKDSPDLRGRRGVDNTVDTTRRLSNSDDDGGGNGGDA